MFSGMKSSQHKGPRGFISADQFNENINVGMENDRLGAAREDILESQLSDMRHSRALVANHRQLHGSSDLRFNQRTALLQHLHNAGPDRAKTDEPQANRMFHGEG